MARRVVKTDFLNAYFDRLPQFLENPTLGFRELRAATEIENSILWEKLVSLIPRISTSSKTDYDG